MNSNRNGNGYKYINNLWKTQNFPIYCANNPDAAVRINFIITYLKKKGKVIHSTQFSIKVFLSIFYKKL